MSLYLISVRLPEGKAKVLEGFASLVATSQAFLAISNMPEDPRLDSFRRAPHGGDGQGELLGIVCITVKGKADEAMARELEDLLQSANVSASGARLGEVRVYVQA